MSSRLSTRNLQCFSTLTVCPGLGLSIPGNQSRRSYLRVDLQFFWSSNFKYFIEGWSYSKSSETWCCHLELPECFGSGLKSRNRKNREKRRHRCLESSEFSSSFVAYVSRFSCLTCEGWPALMYSIQIIFFCSWLRLLCLTLCRAIVGSFEFNFVYLSSSALVLEVPAPVIWNPMWWISRLKGLQELILHAANSRRLCSYPGRRRSLGSGQGSTFPEKSVWLKWWKTFQPVIFGIARSLSLELSVTGIRPEGIRSKPRKLRLTSNVSEIVHTNFDLQVNVFFRRRP